MKKIVVGIALVLCSSTVVAESKPSDLNAPSKTKKGKQVEPPCHRHHKKVQVKPQRPSFPQKSIYHVNSKWKNQENQTISFSHFRGKVQLMAMVYTHCPQACPMIIADLKSIEDGLTTEEKKKIGFVLVSIDPQRDTPQRLKKYAQMRSLDSRWSLLHGSSEQILELSLLLGVRFKKISKEDFAHSNMISVLTTEGVVSHQQIGLNQNPQETIRKIKQLLSKK